MAIVLSWKLFFVLAIFLCSFRWAFYPVIRDESFVYVFGTHKDAKAIFNWFRWSYLMSWNNMPEKEAIKWYFRDLAVALLYYGPLVLSSIWLWKVVSASIVHIGG